LNSVPLVKERIKVHALYEQGHATSCAGNLKEDMSGVRAFQLPNRLKNTERVISHDDVMVYVTKAIMTQSHSFSGCNIMPQKPVPEF
jgi:hypothetical protein